MRGAIAAGHPLTAEAGARVLENGGNAVDACIAAAFAAFVTEGPLTGPAGGGFLLAHVEGEATLLDCFFSVPAEALGEIEHLTVDFGSTTQSYHVGEGSIAVPGLLPGLRDAHRRFGQLRWEELVAPAIEIARAGVDVSEAQAFLHEILVAVLQRDDGGRRIYADADHLDTSELAATLERIGADPVAAVRGLLPELESDLDAYRPVEREPLRSTIDGREVLTTPAPSRGGAIVAAALAGFGASTSLDGRAQALREAYGAESVGGIAGTTHISVIDAAGNAAGLSSTLGAGSGVHRGGTQLNNMLGEFDVIGSGELIPGERLASMMTPTLVLEEGRPRLVLGSAGSVRLAGAIAQVADAVISGAAVGEAITAPRFHVVGERELHLEGGWPAAAAEELPEGVWEVSPWQSLNLYFGGVSAVELRADGSLDAAGDPRRGGHGIVV
ncbi:MAG: gamma-glutamyltransferase [Gaiellaceae bacterium MAG52_C11]|nr:gamma-glutamyltransferase [Candidatus Gaiellasilicea maunaloa]